MLQVSSEDLLNQIGDVEIESMRASHTLRIKQVLYSNLWTILVCTMEMVVKYLSSITVSRTYLMWLKLMISILLGWLDVMSYFDIGAGDCWYGVDEDFSLFYFSYRPEDSQFIGQFSQMVLLNRPYGSAQIDAHPFSVTALPLSKHSLLECSARVMVEWVILESYCLSPLVLENEWMKVGASRVC